MIRPKTVKRSTNASETTIDRIELDTYIRLSYSRFAPVAFRSLRPFVNNDMFPPAYVTAKK